MGCCKKQNVREPEKLDLDSVKKKAAGTAVSAKDAGKETGLAAAHKTSEKKDQAKKTVEKLRETNPSHEEEKTKLDKEKEAATETGVSAKDHAAALSGNVGSALTGAAATAGRKISDSASKATENIKEAFGGTKEKAEENLDSSKKTSEENADEAKAKLKQGGDEGKESWHELVDAVQRQSSKGMEKSESKVESLKRKLTGESNK